MEIAGNESLDYCISAGHSSIIEPEWDRQDPSDVCQRKMDGGGGGIAEVALTESHHSFFPAVLMMHV